VNISPELENDGSFAVSFYALKFYVPYNYCRSQLCYSGVFVCPSVRLSHAGIESKLMNVGQCSFHDR